MKPSEKNETKPRMINSEMGERLLRTRISNLENIIYLHAMFPCCLLHHAHKCPRLMTQLYKYKNIFLTYGYAKHRREGGKHYSHAYLAVENCKQCLCQIVL